MSTEREAAIRLAVWSIKGVLDSARGIALRAQDAFSGSQEAIIFNELWQAIAAIDDCAPMKAALTASQATAIAREMGKQPAKRRSAKA